MISEFDRAGLTVLERGWLSSNNVLFADNGAQEAVLVDTGYWSHGAQTVSLVRQLLAGRPLGRVVNTHLHSDHCGGNQALQAAFGCAIDVPAGEAAKVDAWDEAALSFRWTGQHCPAFRRTGSIRAGETLLLGDWGWEVIGSPGHDPESVVLYQPELELLISADALWENGFGVVFPELENRAGFDDVRETLETLAGLRVRWVIPGHGAPFTDAAAAIGRAHRRLDSLAADPARHARHAAKVLIKFHLLEVQTQDLDALERWLAANGCIAGIHARHGAALPFRAWWQELVAELTASGALHLRDGVVENA